MCYAIPGKVIQVTDNIISVDYFGETRRAKNEFLEISVGDYIYAQGGFVVQKIPASEALLSLETWQELFFKLKEIDRELAKENKGLYQRANFLRQKHLGNACCIHGIIEFSNYCTNDCLYCGIRKSNSKISRYRMDVDEILEVCRFAVKELNFKALVLQSGEDLWYTKEKLTNIVSRIMKEFPVLVILSIGERDLETYKELYQKGARAILMRFETGNPALYERYRPGKILSERLNLIRSLHDIGYLIFTGFLIGLPQQTEQDILNDIELAGALNSEMFSFGPFIPHPDTPLKDAPKPSLDLALSAIARARIKFPQSRILVTTALETLDNESGTRLGLMSGGNSLMINVTPLEYKRRYEIYPGRAGLDEDISSKIDSTIKLLQSIGRAPTDLGV